MAAVIIKKKDVERLGKEVLKEVYDFLHNDYIVNTFEEMKEDQKKFLKYLVLIGFRDNKSLKTKVENNKLVFEIIDENKFEEDVKSLKSRVENGSLNTEEIYHILVNIKLDEEIDGDLFFKKKAFLDIFRVFEYAYSYLED